MDKTKVTYMDVDSLIPYANNPRLNDNAVDAVAASIKEFGFKVPIVVDGENVIINGNTRLKAAHKLGLTQVPVIVADDLTPGQVKAFRLADNKTSELAEWDVGKLDIELGEIPDIDMGTFGFELDTGGDWFSREEREFDEHEEGNDEYNEFVDKFKEKKTTDDCYTPDNVYDAVADFVASEYGVKREDMVRPFFPGGDYRNEKYPECCCVVDNPPFSILAEIQRFYQERGIPFFLFGPTLTIFSAGVPGVCYIPCRVAITYENGASINTSFLTNMETGIVVRTLPKLNEALNAANEENLAKIKRHVPKYSYPSEVITAAMVSRWSDLGVDFSVRADECMKISALDAQKEEGSVIYGGGYLLSEAAAEAAASAETNAAAKARANGTKSKAWTLSDREREIVASLGSNRE